MTDIVERLYRVIATIVDNGYEESSEICEEAANEIERLEHMQANLHGHIKRLEDEKSALALEIARSDTGGLRADNLAVRTENAKLREALCIYDCARCGLRVTGVMS